MRQDLNKILLDGPTRTRGSDRKKKIKGYKRKCQKEFQHDECSKKESMKEGIGWNGRPSGLRYSVLRKILVGQAGKKWDDIYSDLKHQLKGNPHLETLMEYVKNNVVVNVVVKDGKYYNSEYPFEELNKSREWHGIIGYVHPETGVLIIPPKKDRKLRRIWKRKTPTTVVLEEYVWAIKDAAGIWWRCYMDDVPPEPKINIHSWSWVQPNYFYDAFVRRRLTKYDLYRYYDCPYWTKQKYCTKVEQMSKVAIRRMKRAFSL